MSSDVEANVTKNDRETLRNETFLKNARNYVWLASKKNRSHVFSALKWERFFYGAQLSLIILTSLSTILAVIEDKLPIYVLPIISGIATIVSSVMGVLKPQDKQKLHLESARRFKILMLKLVSCDDMAKYKRVRQEIQHELMDAPFTYPITYPEQNQEDKKSGEDATDGPPANNNEKDDAKKRLLKERKQKKQQKRDDIAKQMWAINPILKIQLTKTRKYGKIIVREGQPTRRLLRF